MKNIPDALQPLARFNQWMLYKLVPGNNGKKNKIPVNLSLEAVDPHDPQQWVDAQTATRTASVLGDEYGAAFVFTESDPFYFVDIDAALQPDGQWSPIANELCSRLQGAAVEVSQSGTGLHIFGTGDVPTHGCKNVGLGLELYTEKRFVALTGVNCIGDASHNTTLAMSGIVNDYFPPGVVGGIDTWTKEPVAEWNGHVDDNALIDAALKSKSAANAFGGSASFADLWNRNVDVLSDCYTPDAGDVGTFDESSADMALAQQLAFWTGNHCERIFLLMWKSGLVRDKWNRKDYLIRTIQRAVNLQTTVYTAGTSDDIVDDGLPVIKGTRKQVDWARKIRAAMLEQCDTLPIDSTIARDANFWINNKDKTIVKNSHRNELSIPAIVQYSRNEE